MAEKVTLTIDMTPEERQHIEEELVEKAKLVEDLRQSIHEAMSGQTLPISELWKTLDDNE